MTNFEINKANKNIFLKLITFLKNYSNFSMYQKCYLDKQFYPKSIISTHIFLLLKHFEHN